MRWRTLWLVGIAALVIVVVAVIALASQQLKPAFQTAVSFVEAAGKGDDPAALALLSDPLRAYAAAHCPNGSPSACVASYTPPAWGKMVSAVFRRADPDGSAWNVEVIANYQQDKGASGVCIYTRVEPDVSGVYHITAWAGFISCGDPASRNMDSNPDTPNRAP